MVNPIPVKPINEIEEKVWVTENDKILMYDADSQEARLASKEELRWPQWEQWEKWEQWEQGIQWPVWPKWDKWDKGDRWEQGIQGIQWPIWPIWPVWPQWIKWDTGNWITTTTFNPDYTLTINYSDWRYDSTWNIRWPQGEQWIQGIQWPKWDVWPQWEQGIQWDKWDKWDQWIQGIQWVKWDTGAKWDKWDTWPQWPTWNWIASIDVVKSWKTNTITITETNGTQKQLTVQDWADGEWSGDMSMVTYDPTSKMADVFDAQNHYNLDEELDINSTHAVQNKVITAKINDIELSKAPNVSIVGTPTITQWNISWFSTSNYLIAPFLSSFAWFPFTFHIDITTWNDVTTQQNIIDAEFGMAFAIRSWKFVIALSTTWTNWDLWEHTGTYTVKANQSYCIEIAWSVTDYTVKYSVDRVNFYQDILVVSNKALSWNTLYLGWHWVTDHPSNEHLISMNGSS